MKFLGHDKKFLWSKPVEGRERPVYVGKTFNKILFTIAWICCLHLNSYIMNFMKYVYVVIVITYDLENVLF